MSAPPSADQPHKRRRRSRRKSGGQQPQDEGSESVQSASDSTARVESSAPPEHPKGDDAGDASFSGSNKTAETASVSTSAADTRTSHKRPREEETPHTDPDTHVRVGTTDGTNDTQDSAVASFWDSIALPTDDISINIAPPSTDLPKTEGSESSAPSASRPNRSRDFKYEVAEQAARPRTVKFADEISSRQIATPSGSAPSVHDNIANPEAAHNTGDFFAQNNPFKPSAVGTHHALGQSGQTVSLAVPGSVVLNAQSAELRARLVAHIARAAAIFNIDEIVVWHDASPPPAMPTSRGNGTGRFARTSRVAEGGTGKDDDKGTESHEEGRNPSKSLFDPDQFMVRLLSYLETPQYLRKSLIPMHPDLRQAGLLPPLDLPAHVRRDDDVTFREGVVVGPSPKGGRNRGPKGAWDVDVGLWDYVHVLPPPPESGLQSQLVSGQRVTVRMPRGKRGRSFTQSQEAELVPRSAPTQEQGTYWGYVVRFAPSLADVFKSSTFVPAPDERGVDAYDLVVGTSERGTGLSQVLAKTFTSPVLSGRGAAAGAVPSAASDDATAEEEQSALRPFHHALIVFGGVSGLEVAVEEDQGIPLSAGQAHQLFDTWINVAEDQGSRTIRTEEAVLIALARLAPALRALGITAQ